MQLQALVQLRSEVLLLRGEHHWRLPRVGLLQPGRQVRNEHRLRSVEPDHVRRRAAVGHLSLPSEVSGCDCRHTIAVSMSIGAA